MAHWLPPYLNKEVKQCKAELKKAEKNEVKAKNAYAFAQEYTALCKKHLEEALKNAQESESKSGN